MCSYFLSVEKGEPSEDMNLLIVLHQYDSLKVNVSNSITENIGFCNISTSREIIVIMRTLLLQFLLLILLAISCSGTEGFRSFLGRMGLRRRALTTSLQKPSYAGEVEEDENVEKQERTLRELFWQDFSFLNFSSFSSDDFAFDQAPDEKDFQANVIHFCFLVHGLRGFSKDLGYLQAAMRRAAHDRKQKLLLEREFIPDPSNNTAQPNAHKRQDLVIHATVCNERKTDDGIEAGGERLLDEITSVIQQEMVERERNATTRTPVITVSFLGNSLGGLYSRYAVAKLVETCQQHPDGHLVLDGKYKFYLNVFCTTATPHLGVASLTYFPLPRIGEVAMAHTMGQTFRDIFRVNDLMRRMATLSHFLGPMKLFRQRIAYANAYGTDFPVPVHTAAFLHDESDYPHHFVENRMQQTIVEEYADLCIATLHTPPQHDNHSDDNFVVAKDHDELAVMSRSLDALGWRKVFVDPRKIVPKVSNPIGRAASLRLSLSTKLNKATGLSVLSSLTTMMMSDGENSSTASEEEEEESVTANNGADVDMTIDRLKARGVAPSREVFRAVTASPLTREHLHWPSGHNMIVAMSRNAIYNHLNKPGRPIVDALATELVDDILAFSEDTQ